MSANNDSLLQIKEIVKIYANLKYLDRNVRWVRFILAEYDFQRLQEHQQISLALLDIQRKPLTHSHTVTPFDAPGKQAF